MPSHAARTCWSHRLSPSSGCTTVRLRRSGGLPLRARGGGAAPGATGHSSEGSWCLGLARGGRPVRRKPCGLRVEGMGRRSQTAWLPQPGDLGTKALPLLSFLYLSFSVLKWGQRDHLPPRAVWRPKCIYSHKMLKTETWCIGRAPTTGRSPQCCSYLGTCPQVNC